jgi:HSP20 family protein
MGATRMTQFPFLGWRYPFAEMQHLARQMDQMANAMFERPEMRWLSSKVFPAVNITEDKDNYYVRAELPGIKTDEIQLEVTGKNLAISGERKIQSEGGSAKYHRKEREEGQFSRIISLPGEVNSESVNAKLVHGILTVAIAKSETTKPRQIEIN